MKIFFIFLLFYCFSIKGNSFAVINSDTSSTKSFKVNSFSDSSRVEIDTILHGFQLFPGTSDNNFFSGYTGNFGLPFFSYDYFTLDRPGFFGTGELIPMKPGSNLYYNTKKPYTIIDFFTSTIKSQSINILHSQSANKYLNFGIKYNVVSVDGPFKRQRSLNHFFCGFASFNSSIYNAYLSLIYKKAGFILNGGIESDSLFDIANDPVETFPVRLQSASTDIFSKGISFNHSLKFFKSSDSLAGYLFSFGHSFFLTQTSKNYRDVRLKNTFYYNWYLDSVTTFDSVFHNTMQNRVFISLNDNFSGKFPIGIRVGGLNETFKYGYKTFDTIASSSGICGSIYSYSTTKYRLDLSGEYYMVGHRKNNYSFNGNVRRYLKTQNDSSFIQLSASAESNIPDFFYSRYSSNNFIWQNNFKDEIINKVRLEYNNKRIKFSAGFRYSTIDNFIYFDSIAKPRQNDTMRLTVTGGYLTKNFKLGFFHMNNTIVYQYIDREFLQLPQLMLYQSLYFRFGFFKMKLPTHIGFDIFYYSSFFANSYMPATNIFYEQHIKKVGGYPIFDFFISAQRKKVRMYLKVEHLNSLLGRKYYYYLPNYPMNDLNFKFGVSWRFSD